MIKARISLNNRKTLVLGFSGENVTRLAAGEPILTRLDDVGFEGMDLIVLYGKTEDDALADMKRLLVIGDD